MNLFVRLSKPGEYGALTPFYPECRASHMPLDANQLSEESKQATESLRGKVVSHVIRHRESEVALIFTDGTRFFVDQSFHGVELSISGGRES